MNRKLALTAAAVLALLAPGHAAAAPVGVWLQAPDTLTVGVPATFSGTAEGCASGLSGRVDWSWVWRTAYGATQTGGQLGQGATITATFGAYAQSKPYITVVGKVGCAGTTNNYALVSRSYTVQAAPTA
jgi:hypothetical protein